MSRIRAWWFQPRRGLCCSERCFLRRAPFATSFVDATPCGGIVYYQVAGP